jgi:hypothetical protein
LASVQERAQAVTASLLCCCAAVLAGFSWLQHGEAWLTARVLAFVMFSDAHVAGGTNAVVFTMSDGNVMGVQFSALNTVALPALPLLLCSAVAVWLRPDRVRATAVAFGAAMTLLVLENQFRVLLIALISDSVGAAMRYSIGATLFGSVVTVLCWVSSILLFIFTMLRLDRTQGDGSVELT